MIFEIIKYTSQSTVPEMRIENKNNQILYMFNDVESERLRSPEVSA